MLDVRPALSKSLDMQAQANGTTQLVTRSGDCVVCAAVCFLSENLCTGLMPTTAQAASLMCWVPDG
jgi:hypothetical protein